MKATEVPKGEVANPILVLDIKTSYGLELPQDDIIETLTFLTATAVPSDYKDYDAFKVARTFLSEIASRDNIDDVITDLAKSFAHEIEDIAGSDFTKEWLFERRRQLSRLTVTRATEFAEAKIDVDYWTTQECIYYETQIDLIDKRILNREY